MYDETCQHLRQMLVARDWRGLHEALSFIPNSGNPVVEAYRFLATMRLSATPPVLPEVCRVALLYPDVHPHGPMTTSSEVGFIGLVLAESRLSHQDVVSTQALAAAKRAYSKLGCVEGLIRTSYLEAMNQIQKGAADSVEALSAIVVESRTVDASVYFASMQNLAVAECTQGRTLDALQRLLTMLSELEALHQGNGTTTVSPSSVVFAHDGPHAVHFDARKHLLSAYGQLAILLAEKGAVDQATEYYSKGLEMLRSSGKPSELATWCNNMAVLRMDADDADGAEQLLKEAMQFVDTEVRAMKPIHDALVFSMARCRALQHRYSDAVAMLDTLAENTVEARLAIDAHILKAECFVDMGAAHLAVALAEHVLQQVDPEGQRVRVLRARAVLAQAHAAMGNASWIQALATVATAMETSNLLPDAVRTYRTLARVSQHAGDVQGALDALRLATDRVGALHQQSANDRSQVLSTLFQVELVRSRAQQAEAAAQVERLQHEKTSDVLHQVNEALLAHKAELAAFRNGLANIVAGPGRSDEKLAALRRQLRDAPNMRDSWEHYVEVFSMAHPRFLRSVAERCPMLTSMEIRVCVLTRAGMTSEEIADVLCLSPRTIESHRLNIRKKFGLSGRTSLAALLSTM